MPQLVKLKQMAEQLSSAPRTVRNYVRDGIIPAYKMPGKKFSNGHHEIARGVLLFDPEAVALALSRYAINQPRPPRRRAGRLPAVTQAE